MFSVRFARRCQTTAMELPQHWVKAEEFSPDLGHRGGVLRVWGWSSESEADASLVAQRRLTEALGRVALERGSTDANGYYPRMPLREPVLERVESGSGALMGVVTRNRMGCEVLCTDLLFIADIDDPGLEEESRVGFDGLRDRSGQVAAAFRSAPEGQGEGGVGRRIKGFLQRVVTGDPAPTPMTLGDDSRRDAGQRTGEAGAAPGPSATELAACEPVWNFAGRHPDLGVRLYRTAAGLRVLLIGAGATPGSDRARQLLTELGSDPLYVELCRTHDSYRARLTPKPYRVGVDALTERWPYGDDRARSIAGDWVVDYDAAASGHAVCRLVSASGPVPGPDEQRLVDLHDRRCRTGEDLPLA